MTGTSDQPAPIAAAALAGRPLRMFDLVMAAFVTILLLSNVIGAGKIAVVTLPGIGPWPFGAGILFFPLSYRARRRADRSLWLCPCPPLHLGGVRRLAVHGVHVADRGGAAAGAGSWHGQEAYEAVFGQVPRIVFASILAFWAGEFVNSYVLARMKLLDPAAAICGAARSARRSSARAADSLIFYPLAFWGVAGQCDLCSRSCSPNGR